jgi:hypothetical protein
MSSKPTDERWFRLPNSQQASLRLILGVFAIVGLLYAFTFGVVVNPWTKANITIPLYQATGQFLHPELLVYLGGLAFIIALLSTESLSVRDVGLDMTKFRTAIIGIALIWTIAQTLLVVPTLVATGQLPVSSGILSEGVLVLAGILAKELFGNSLFEEVVYRGFLPEQIRLYTERLAGFSTGPNLSLAIIVSQAVFGLVHIPIRLYQGATLSQTALSVSLLFVLGLLFALVYYRTGNLFLAIGVHTLHNVPIFVFGTPAQWPVWVASITLLLVWPRIEPKLQAKHSTAGASLRTE